MEKKFEEGEIVWVKLKGYPWWPAVIVQSPQNEQQSSLVNVLVNFIGDNSQYFILF
jgi:hypothetical protein